MIGAFKVWGAIILLCVHIEVVGLGESQYCIIVFLIKYEALVMPTLLRGPHLLVLTYPISHCLVKRIGTHSSSGIAWDIFISCVLHRHVLSHI